MRLLLEQYTKTMLLYFILKIGVKNFCVTKIITWIVSICCKLLKENMCYIIIAVNREGA